MDEEQLQDLQRRHQAAGESGWQMGGGTAGLRAPAYTNNGTYLAPDSNQRTNPVSPLRRPTTIDPNAMYDRGPQGGGDITAPAYGNSGGNSNQGRTPVVPARSNSSYATTGRFDMRPNAAYLREAESPVTPATSTNGNNQNPIIDAGRTVMNAGNDALGNAFVGEGINILADTNGVARNVSRGMPVAGLYYDSTGLYDNYTGTGSAANASNEERAYNMVANGTGLISSTISTAELLGQGLAAASNGLAGSAGTSLVAATGEGTALAGAGALAGSAAALLSAGAGGYAIGTYVDEETGLADDLSNSASIGINGSLGPNPDVRGFIPDEGIGRNHVERSLSDNIANSAYLGINGSMGPNPTVRGFIPGEGTARNHVQRGLSDNIASSLNIAINGGMGPNVRGFRADDANIAAD